MFYNQHFDSIANFNEFSPISESVVKEIALPYMQINDSYGVSYSGLILISKEGVYTFYLTSDDGSRLYLDDYMLINNDGIHAAKTILGQIGLLKGFHKIKLEYFNYTNIDSLVIQLDGPGLKKSYITADYLYYQK